MTPCPGQPDRLTQHVAGSAADEGAAEAGDGAERAAPVAAAGQLERRHRAAVEPAAYGAGTAQPGDADVVDRGTALDRGDREQPAAVVRGVGLVGLAGHDRPQPRGDVGVVVEARARRRPRAARSRGPCRSARRGSRPRPRPGCGRSALRSAASSRVSTLSFLAASTNPQVLTTTVSASSASSTSRKPSASSRPASSSESTSLRAQPRVTRATESGAGADVVMSARVCRVRPGSPDSST